MRKIRIKFSKLQKKINNQNNKMKVILMINKINTTKTKIKGRNNGKIIISRKLMKISLLGMSKLLLKRQENK